MGLLSAAYFDASGKESYPFLSVAGAASPIKKWVRFERLWSEVLSEEGVTEFHATDFAASAGEYVGWKDDRVRRSRFVRRLTAIAKQNVNKLFISTIGKSVWDEVNQEYPIQETFHVRYALAGFAVVNQTIKWAKRNRRVQDPFKIFFEDGDAGWGHLKSVCLKYNRFEPIRIPKKEGIAFQLTDLLAWKARIASTNVHRRIREGHGLEDVLTEVDSLERAFMCPVDGGVFTYRSLVATCKNMGLAKRRPVTAA